MTTELFYNLRDDLGLTPIGVGDGEELVSEENPDVTYSHPNGRAHGYDLGTTEKEDFIIETLSDRGEQPEMYLVASELKIGDLDEYLMEKINDSDSGKHYKKIH
jgi:hypothetical protein